MQEIAVVRTETLDTCILPRGVGLHVCLGVVSAEVGEWILCDFVFDIEFRTNWGVLYRMVPKVDLSMTNQL